MSYTQWLGQQGGAIQPNITEDILIQMIRDYGSVLSLYRKGQTINCTCYSKYYGTFDRSCSTCGGTGSIGGYTEEPAFSFMGIFHPRSEGKQDQHQRIIAKPGQIDTVDGRIYCEAKWFLLIELDDVVVWIPKGESKGYELRIISRIRHLGNNNQGVYTQLDVTKNPYPLRTGANDLRKRA